jgi:predicted RNA binding protein YcfA (HicA-like mRNA interferase family)
MTQSDKLIRKLRAASSTFSWLELVTLLSRLGYEKYKRAGSRVVFINTEGHAIHLHKPHPENYIKGGALKDVKHHLKNTGVW